jgi:2-dehydro-3-deoxygluconokinase
MSGAIVGFGEILLRLASAPPALLFQEMRLEASFCGAEANALVALAGFGHDCRMVTVLPDNPVGRAASRTVGTFGVDMSRAAAQPDGRMGLFFLQPGAMTRPSAITYDRAGSAFAETGAQHYDWPSLLEGAEWLFVSGITAALGDGPLAALHDAMAEAQARGVKIAFDTNFRPNLWRGREQLAARILRELSAKADLLFAGRRAVAMMAGGDYAQADPDQGFHAAAQRMFELAPGLLHVAATRRTIHSTDRQDLVGLLADRDGLSVSPTIALEAIVDRVGTGDAFAAGVVHGLIAGLGRAATIEFAAACAQWGHSVPGDFLRASLADITGLMNGGGDVSR